MYGVYIYGVSVRTGWPQSVTGSRFENSVIKSYQENFECLLVGQNYFNARKKLLVVPVEIIWQ